MRERNESVLLDVLKINHAVLPDAGEDSFALRSDEQGAFLCVTDGCGGLGSKRYANLENKTGAYLAARLAARAFDEWAQERRPALGTQEEAQILCREAERSLFDRLKGFADAHCSEEKSRIVGSMQRRLPTTLCAATIERRDVCFFWAGDSRGYVMDEEGLRQYTRDHVRGETDAFETLYRDAPLSNLLSADKLGRIQQRSVHLDKPSLVITATDGIYSSLPTPMEVEMLLLDTLRLARSLPDWEKKLHKQAAANAQDDATLLIASVGFHSFDELKSVLLPRREALQKQFITPVRRHKGDQAYARAKWQQYRAQYDCTEDDHG